MQKTGKYVRTEGDSDSEEDELSLRKPEFSLN